MNRELLTRPFEPHQIKQRPGQHGRTLSYVETHAVIARLNEGCDSWSFEIISHEVQGDEVIVLGKLTADGMVKSAFGGSTITIDKSGQVVSVADDLKAAASDSLKKCASLFGVGLELYGGAAQAAGGEQHERAPGLANPADRVTTRQLAAIHAEDQHTHQGHREEGQADRRGVRNPPKHSTARAPGPVRGSCAVGAPSRRHLDRPVCGVRGGEPTEGTAARRAGARR